MSGCVAPGSGFGATAGSERSWPAQKARPAPVTTTQRTAGSAAAASSAASNSACIAVVKLLSDCGRLSVSVRTAASSVTSTSRSAFGAAGMAGRVRGGSGGRGRWVRRETGSRLGSRKPVFLTDRSEKSSFRWMPAQPRISRVRGAARGPHRNDRLQHRSRARRAAPSPLRHARAGSIRARPRNPSSRGTPQRRGST